MFCCILFLTAVLCQEFSRFDLSQCIGVWSSNLVGGKLSFVEIEIKPVSSAGKLAAAVFNFKDRFHIQAEELAPDYKLCSNTDIVNEVCKESELEKFHVKDAKSNIPILNELIKWSSDERIHSENTSLFRGGFKLKYLVQETGYYCIFLGSDQSKEGLDFKAIFKVNNPYGQLPAIFLPALPLFAVLSIIYTAIGILWISLCFWYWKDLLTIQYYVSWVIVFLVLEMAFNYGFYDNYNAFGIPS